MALCGSVRTYTYVHAYVVKYQVGVKIRGSASSKLSQKASKHPPRFERAHTNFDSKLKKELAKELKTV